MCVLNRLAPPKSVGAGDASRALQRSLTPWAALPAPAISSVVSRHSGDVRTARTALVLRAAPAVFRGVLHGAGGTKPVFGSPALCGLCSPGPPLSWRPPDRSSRLSRAECGPRQGAASGRASKQWDVSKVVLRSRTPRCGCELWREGTGAPDGRVGEARPPTLAETWHPGRVCVCLCIPL